MPKYWFKPKTHGYGAGPPTCWQGWAFVGGFLAVVLGVSFLLPRAFMDKGLGTAVAVGIVLLLAIPFIWVCRVKTEGEWRWRWGGRGGNPGP